MRVGITRLTHSKYSCMKTSNQEIALAMLAMRVFGVVGAAEVKAGDPRETRLDAGYGGPANDSELDEHMMETTGASMRLERFWG